MDAASPLHLARRLPERRSAAILSLPPIRCAHRTLACKARELPHVKLVLVCGPFCVAHRALAGARPGVRASTAGV